MSALLKNLHVHFDDDVLSESATKSITGNEVADNRNGAPSSVMLNYSREKLLEFGQSKASKEPPKMFDLSGADDKRMEKIRHVLKNSDVWKSLSKYSWIAFYSVVSFFASSFDFRMGFLSFFFCIHHQSSRFFRDKRLE